MQGDGPIGANPRRQSERRTWRLSRTALTMFRALVRAQKPTKLAAGRRAAIGIGRSSSLSFPSPSPKTKHAIRNEPGNDHYLIGKCTLGNRPERSISPRFCYGDFWRGGDRMSRIEMEPSSVPLKKRESFFFFLQQRAPWGTGLQTPRREIPRTVIRG